MADLRERAALARGRAAAQAPAIDEGLRAYMLRVYNYMASGLLLTAIVAMFAHQSGIYYQIAATPLMWVMVLAPLGVVFFLSFRVHKMSVAQAQAWFWIYAALVGLSLAGIFAVYTGTSIARVFFITAGMFGAMSLFGYTTKRDLTNWGSLLFMGLIGLLIAMVVNMFLASDGLSFAISVIGVLVFTGLTAYDTQRIKEMYFVGDDALIAGRKAVMGALALYLDFLNLFLMLLRLMGGQRE